MERWVEQILNTLTIEELPEGYQAVARIVGIENAVRLSDELGGLNYYFPQAEKMLRIKRNELINKEFTGANHKELAQKYRLSEVQIREIVARPKHHQDNLFQIL
jgi:Mor family transcriptional regulator